MIISQKIKKILFLIPTYFDDSSMKKCYRYLPAVGVGILATILSKLHYEVKIFDVMGRENQLQGLINKFNPDCIAVFCMTTMYPQFFSLIQQIRHQINFDKLLIAGGPHITLSPFTTLEQLDIDILVVGEGEDVVVWVLDCFPDKLSGLKNIPGILAKDINTIGKRRVVDINNIPFPDFRLYELGKYEADFLRIEVARGCPYNCIFCASKMLYQYNGVRFRLPSQLRSHIIDLKQLGYKNFAPIADTFVLNKDWLREFADNVADLEVEFMVNGRIDLMSNEILSLLKRARCKLISYGLEDINQDVLNNISKKITTDQIVETLKRTHEQGFKMWLYFMISLPGQTLDYMERTINFAHKIKEKYGCGYDIQICRIYPGTPLGEKVGLNKKNWQEFLYRDVPYGNVPIYHEYAIEKVMGIWKKEQRYQQFNNISLGKIFHRFFQQ